MVIFRDRVDAGRQLAERLSRLAGENVVVLGLPRGGVPVAAEVAAALDAPLDVILVRKLGLPFQPELGMGAIGEDGVRVLNRDVLRLGRVSARDLATVEERERVELRRRADRYRDGRAPVPVTGCTAVVVDDGIATGSTARAACEVARAHGAARVVLAVPVAPADWTQRMGDAADQYVCLDTPPSFLSIGQLYRDFRQVDDDEVVACLRRAHRPSSGPVIETVSTEREAVTSPVALDDPLPRDEELSVHADGVMLGGHLVVPMHCSGLVVFAHGSGSSRHSPRNAYVASMLNGAGLATLLFDLLTPAEETERANVFDISLLGWRLAEVTRWLHRQPDLAALPLGYFGASTGAAAALWASTEPGIHVDAIVSRGGRPDLAAARLAQVTAPTLLVVGGRDEVVLELNRRVRQILHCECRLSIVPGATHLFEEPGTLRAAAEMGRAWFTRHLAPVTSSVR